MVSGNKLLLKAQHWRCPVSFPFSKGQKPAGGRLAARGKVNAGITSSTPFVLHLIKLSFFKLACVYLQNEPAWKHSHHVLSVVNYHSVTHPR